MQADALVVGAGPAGSVAALVLARAGLKVQLIDRAAFPRHKLCGDTLNPGSLALLDRLCANVSSSVVGRSLPIRGMTVTGPGGAQVTAEYPHGLCGAAITRRELDLLLLDAAIAAGAVFESGLIATAPAMSDDGARVIGARLVAGERRSVRHARVLIAADGRGSRLASALALSRFARTPRRWAFGAYFTEVDGLTDRGEMHVRTDGYVGVAPLPDGVTNVCVVRELGGVRGRGMPAAEIVSNALASDPMLEARFARAHQISEVVSLGPLAIDCRAAGHPGLLLAGDAAGFIDPITGDGLRFAIRGGELASEAALAELAEGRPAFNSLTSARAREFRSKWRINRALRFVVGSPLALELAALIAARWDTPVRHLIGTAGDIALAVAQGSRLRAQGSRLEARGSTP